WFRYVDDTFVRFSDSSQATLSQFHDFINSIHPSIQFTMDAEKDGAIPFLDVLVSSSDGHYATSVYRKPTCTNLLVRWESAHPRSVKLGVLKTLVHRARTICSDDRLIQSETRKLKSIFSSNGYPSSIVSRTITQYMSEPPRPAEPRKPYITCVLPYVPGVCDAIQRSWKRLVANSALPIPEARFVFKPFRKLGPSVSRPYTNSETKGVVYAVSCTTCGKRYIGETGRYLSTRLHEHQTRPQSEVFAHRQLGHVLDLDEVRVVGRETDPSRRRIQETFHCLEAGSQNLINRQMGHLYLFN
ncbi:MAG: hypothetical protein GY696_31320, partial [Gammaproteobacteria bacterium]|nr:hypothetical protein [Gammaproteobacteria bacterium]